MCEGFGFSEAAKEGDPKTPEGVKLGLYRARLFGWRGSSTDRPVKIKILVNSKHFKCAKLSKRRSFLSQIVLQQSSTSQQFAERDTKEQLLTFIGPPECDHVQRSCFRQTVILKPENLSSRQNNPWQCRCNELQTLHTVHERERVCHCVCLWIYDLYVSSETIQVTATKQNKWRSHTHG